MAKEGLAWIMFWSDIELTVDLIYYKPPPSILFPRTYGDAADHVRITGGARGISPHENDTGASRYMV